MAACDPTINDLDALAEACASMGLELVRGQRTFRWSGMHPPVALPDDFARGYNVGDCAHAVRLAGNSDAFEIGVVPLADGGGYGLVWDEWRGGLGLQAVAGAGCSRLFAKYHGLRACLC